MTQGAAKLSALVAKHGSSSISRRLGLTEGAVRHYATGRRVPGSLLRDRIAAVDGIDILPAEWEAGQPAAVGRSPKTKAAPPLARPRSDITPGGMSAAPLQKAAATSAETPPDKMTTRDEAARAVAVLSRQVAAADVDPLATWQAKATLGQALMSSIRVLAKLDGSGELTDSQVARSKPFRNMVQRIAKALEGHHAAAVAVADVLEQIDRGTS